MAYNTENLTSRQIARYIKERPAIILPLGGCEPFGEAGVVGTESICVAGIAAEVSKRCNILTAPLIPFGCSTPFMAFAGAAGIKPRTFVNMLCEILHGYILQGITKIFLINAVPFNREPAEEAGRRLENKYMGVKVTIFNLCATTDRNDALLLSIFAYLRPNQFLCPDLPVHTKTTSDKYRTWKKRGRDPQKFRTLYPDGLLLSLGTDIAAGITPERGKEHFEQIVDTLQKEVDKL